MTVDPIVVVKNGAALAGHIAKWLANLNRAKEDRKRQSLLAVNKVVVLVRKTMVYSRALKQGSKDFNVESNLATEWSELAFELSNLKLDALAKKCDLKGRYWADPEGFSKDFLFEADISFQTVDRLARNISVKVKTGNLPKSSK